ncbi:hypothetical protein [Sodalis sp. RH19]|uniref:hypothetical protein n=1 Tax=Sodalis sp. RH19 TaxID=3394334 RepID=UPI0039B375BE
MQKGLPLTSPPCSGPYQSVPQADQAQKSPVPGKTAFSHRLDVASCSSEQVALKLPSDTRRPAGQTRSYWKIWLAGVAVLGGATCAYGSFLRWRSGNIDGGLAGAGVRDNLLPYPLALGALNSTDLNRLMPLATLPEDTASSSRGLNPYRGHVTTRGDGAFAAELHNKNKQIIRFLKKTHYLDKGKKPHEFSKVEITAAVAKYLSFAEPKDKKSIARLLLNAANFYDAHKNDTLSSEQAGSVIGQWLFDNILGTSPDMAMAISVANASYPFMFTIDSIRYLLSSEGLQAEGKVDFNILTETDQAILKNKWDSEVCKHIPLLTYYGRDPQVKHLSLDDFEFASLFSGSLFLYENGINLGETHWREVVKTGALLWDIALRDGVSADMLKYYSLPALLFQAVNHPGKFIAEEESNPLLLRARALDEYRAHRVQVRNALEDLDNKINRFKKAVEQWLTRGQLADSIIDRCPRDTIFPLTIMVNPAMTLEQRNSEGKKHAKEAYLNNVFVPCKTAPESLDNEYKKHTNIVADRYSEWDEILIKNALGSVEKTERDFILADHAIIHRLRIIPFLKANALIPAMRDNGAGHYDFDNIKEADVFSVSLSGEKRYYAMKGKIGIGYHIMRFDQHLPHDGRKEYSNLHPLIAYFNGEAEKSVIKNEDQTNDGLTVFMTNSHRETFYNALYQSGYTLSDLQKIWAVAKNIIPFYDCVDGALKHDLEKAVPACLLDAVAFFTVTAKIADVSQKFGASIIKGLSKSQMVFAGNALTKNTLKSAGAQVIHHIRLPTGKESTSLLIGTLKAADPGVDILSAISSHSLRKLIKHFEQYGKKNQFDKLVDKLKFAEMKKSIPPPVRLNEGKPLSSPVREHTAQSKSGILAGGGQEQQKLQFMFNNNHGHPPQPAWADNPLVDLAGIPDRSTFMAPMNRFYAELYPYKFDHTRDIADAIKQHYASPTTYQFGYGEDILKIPAEFSLLRNHINQFIQEVDRAHSHAAFVKDKFHRTTMTLPEGIMQYPEKNPIKCYLSKVLKTDDPSIIFQAMTRLRYHTEQIVKYFETTKQSIIFATCSTSARPYAYRAQSPMGFTYADDIKSRVIIMVDNFYAAQPLSTLPRHTVLHEVSHHSGSLDFLISPSTSRVGDASEFMESFDDALNNRCTNYVNIEDDFARAFNYDRGNMALGKQQIRELLLRDPMLKANAVMDNADFIARFLTDIAENKPFDYDYIKPKNKRAAALMPDNIRLDAMVSFIYRMAMNSIYNSDPDAT